ncbi:unnamed protein product (macronuclear) [Paramecium tetraurelia]|uniref:Homeobox domain-containing protein n=1 Tax=Paramecium tetraurelia TaxID=5888 RepID=A0BPG9_PARTE|nr:uncharacterized protein GSPATT00005185001 [Paramecium tetraurelia]CAK60436.1 unnamed protein product [Paramecium tetraurelia]|eukprot:XP_001427834.1 hypothetical protein (macronuclear) [Paramecium tetraurelia strain d4-2]
MDKNNPNIKEYILSQLGEDPSEEAIKQVAEKTQVLPILIKQWLHFYKRNNQSQNGQDLQPQKLESVPKFNGKFEQYYDVEDPNYELKQKKQFISDNHQKHTSQEDKTIEKQLKEVEKEIKKRKKLLKTDKKQTDPYFNELYVSDEQNQDFKINDNKQFNLKEQYINVPIYYMIKLEESLMEQAINIHQKIVKIIEAKYDYLNLL